MNGLTTLFSRLQDPVAWAYGLAAAVIHGGIASGGLILASYVSGQKFNWEAFSIIVGVGALSGAFSYLNQSPLPPLKSNQENSSK